MSNHLPNGRWTKDHYRFRRRSLMQQVQPNRRCHKCQRKAPSWQALEFDHLDGRTWEMRKVGSDQRIRIMEREHSKKVRLAGACRRCNAVDGATRIYTTSKARWSAPRLRAKGFRRGQVEFYEAQRHQDRTNRWLFASELYAEVVLLLESNSHEAVDSIAA